MKIIELIQFEDYLLLKTEKGNVKLQPYTPEVIRIIYTAKEEFSSRESLLVTFEKGEKVNWSISESDGAITLTTSKLRMDIDRSTCAFSYFDSNGRLLTREPRHGGKTLTEIDVVKTRFAEDADSKMLKTVDGEKRISENFSTYVDRKGYRTKLEFEWEKDEGIYGLGQHEEGIFNYRGHEQHLFQANMKIAVPVILSTRGYGVFVDNGSLMTFQDNQYGSYLWADTADEMDYYFIYGPQFDQIIRSMRMLTGKAAMLPRWAFGYIQSKEHYRSQEELISVASEYRKRQIPLDCIVQDWKSWTGDLWGQKTFDAARFPEPEKLMEELHGMNVRLMISVWPNMASEGENHKEMKVRGLLLGDNSTYDAFRQEGRELYWEQADRGLFSKGIDAWWCDSTEPFSGIDWQGSSRMEPWERMAVIGAEFKKYLDPAEVNAYSLMHAKGVFEGQTGTDNKKRVVNLIRSAFPGQQKYGTVAWSGDISARWDVMKKQIAEGLNFCITGLPYWTFDIGAFFVGGIECCRRWSGDEKAPGVWFWNGDFDGGCDDLGYRELYVRWFQFGAFLPMFRSHGTDTPREVWRFGEQGSVFHDTLVKFIHLRYRLMPYIYSIAGKVTLEDYTMMRALVFDFMEDENTHNISDQFMFGPAFLVNPVTEAMYYERGSKEITGSERTRKVYLPAACDWYDFWTGEKFSGGQTVNAAAPLEIMPLYVRSGAIIPMGPFVQHSGEKPDGPVELRIYKGADGVFDIYEDEGDNYNYEKSAYSILRILWRDGEKKLIFEGRRGSYDGMAEKREFKIVFVSEGYGTGLDETQNPETVIIYGGERLETQL